MLPRKNFDIQVLRMVISCILNDNKTTPSLAILNMNYSQKFTVIETNNENKYEITVINLYLLCALKITLDFLQKWNQQGI